MSLNASKKMRKKRANRVGPSMQRRQNRRSAARFGPGALIFSGSGEGYHNPFPQVYVTRFTASGYFYTSSGAGTGDYNWTFNLNSLRHPFSGVTTGVTWGNLTPSTYNPIGYSTLLSANLYTRSLVYDTLLEIDVTPQSVTDSVSVSVTPSDTPAQPSTLGAALALPLTKQMTFASGRVYRLGDYPLKYRLATHRYLGFPRFIYDNDISGLYSAYYSAAPDVPYYLVVNLETGDNAILTSPLEIRVRQTFWVKCYTLDVSNMVSVSLSTPEQRRAARERASAGSLESKMEHLTCSRRAGGLKGVGV